LRLAAGRSSIKTALGEDDNIMSRPRERDPSSHSNPDECVVTHCAWDAVVDFTESKFFCTVRYNLVIVKADARALRLDTSALDVRSVAVDGNAASFTLTVPESAKPHLGSCLEIDLGGGAAEGDEKVVEIQYNTSPEASAAQWLPPSQTAGKKHPYVFTQCQAIHARSLLPCQDCPAVKMTYEARVTVPAWATVVMSALSKDETKQSTVATLENGYLQYEFKQPVPIPSYLFALAVGKLESRDISPRCRVWSEPSMVDAVAFEFSQVEEFLVAAESLTLPYQWKRYDLLCLPPSFPYGGMENPCLTFVTPTLLAGDRSLADVVAHEAAHSWSGNLVTNETWQSFWLNEGWTVFLERKIMTKVHGDDRYFDFAAISGWEDLKESVSLMPDKFTKLVPDLGDDDPDDAFSSVPYEKGFNLLYSLEKLVGRENFEKFMKAYFDQFKFSTVNSNQFKDFFETFFEDEASKIETFDWDSWLYKPGLPETPDFDRTLSGECEDLAASWISVDDGETKKGVLPHHDIANWSASRTICFLDSMLGTVADRKRPLARSTVEAMKAKYSMDQSSNSEILFRFCMLAIESGDDTMYPVIVRFITTQGRMKFVRPLYRALCKSEKGKELAISTFLSKKDFYHPICAKMVASDLLPSKKKKRSVTREIAHHLLVGATVGFAVAIGMSILRGRKR